MHPDEIDISNRQLAELIWLYDREPFGDLRADMRSFAVASAVFGKPGTKINPTFPYWDEPLTQEQIADAFAEFNELLKVTNGQRQDSESAGEDLGTNGRAAESR